MEEPSEEETYYLPPEEYTSSFFSSLMTVHVLMHYFFRVMEEPSEEEASEEEPSSEETYDQLFLEKEPSSEEEPYDHLELSSEEEPYDHLELSSEEELYDHLELSSEEEPYVHLEPPEEEPSSEEEPWSNYLSPEEIRSSVFNFLVTVSFFMFYLSRFPLGLFRGLFKDLMKLFLLFTLVVKILQLEYEEREKIKIVSPTPTNMEFSNPRLEQEPCYTESSEEEPYNYLSPEEIRTSFFNFLMIGTILLSYLSLFPLGLFRGLCNFFLIGFFSLAIIMTLIFVDTRKVVRAILSNKIDKDKRKPGDHIYTWRAGYAHHGICVEDGNVIHNVRGAGQGYGIETGLEPFISNSSPSHSKDNPMKPCTSCGDQSNLKGVISSCIECFLCRGDIYLFQYFVTPAFFLAKVRGGTCTLVPSDPLKVVLNRAKVLHRTNGFGVYHILRNNCESFAYYCKTGLPFFSGQVVSFLAAVVFLAILLLPSNTRSDVLAAVGFTAYCACRYMIEKGSTNQALNVPVERYRLWQLWDFGFIILFTMIVLTG